MSEVTQILEKIDRGDRAAAQELFPLVYDELKRLAAHQMGSEGAHHTLQATALVNEAYLRLVKGDADQLWDSRGHFFAAAARAMRSILIDHARKKATLKRGGSLRRADIDSADFAVHASPEALVLMDEALQILADEDSMAAEIVTLRYFAGLSIDEAAQTLGVSARTAYRRWTYARAWLSSQLLEDDP